MSSEDGSKLDRSLIPPPFDESWWSAVLNEEGRDNEKEDERDRADKRERQCNQGTPEDWSWARQLYECDETIELPVIGYNRGGLLVEAHDLRGFIPVSHLVEYEPTEDDVARYDQLGSYVGSGLQLKVIEFDPGRGRLVFSERAALAGPGKRMELLNELEPGQRVRGIVTNITRFGVFVDLGGVEGLIHVSELSWGRVRHPMDVVTCGDELAVQVLSVDREKCRVALSLKELLPDPWETVSQHYEVGEIVEGEVTNVVKFGAFVGIEEGLEGLIHVSELGDGSFMHPRNVVDEGERVRVRIIHIDPADRRLGLSLRQVPQHEMGHEPAQQLDEHPEAY
ncbi:MAG: S1 RNA-binding domain-containing protein [Anaerolineales bacterium]|nr:S1 RNA-binding domain-containing protein [Anaerolineales bacterium]